MPNASLQATLDEAFSRNVAEEGEVGASVVVLGPEGIAAEVHRGRTKRVGERLWAADTLVPVYSATKGPAAAALLLSLHRANLGPDTATGDLWPDFPLPQATIGQMMSHQCGLAWLDRQADVLNHAEVVRAAAAQRPAWSPPEIGYHPRTWGFLVDELVRRLENKPLATFFDQEIRRPLDLDFWISLPEEEEARVAELITGKPDDYSRADPLYRALALEGSESRRAFSSPRGLHGVADMNSHTAHGAGLPAFGGVGSARGLAGFYRALVAADGGGVFPEAVRRWAGELQVQDKDRILLRPLRFTCGFQQDPLDDEGVKLRHLYGPSKQAFGHPGAGGSHAFADPERGLAFAYVMNQMELSVLPGRRAQRLVDAVYDGAAVD